MYRENVLKLYEKERAYQDKKWGGPDHDKGHGLGGFLVFIESYLNEAKGHLTHDHQSATIASLIKVMALSGAALESFAEDFDIDIWRK